MTNSDVRWWHLAIGVAGFLVAVSGLVVKWLVSEWLGWAVVLAGLAAVIAGFVLVLRAYRSPRGY